MGDLPRESLTDAYDNIFSVYHYWVHQNPGTHLYGRIEEDSKWQVWWKNWLVCPPNAMKYRLVGSEIDLLGSFWVELDRIQNPRWNAERVIVF